MYLILFSRVELIMYWLYKYFFLQSKSQVDKKRTITFKHYPNIYPLEKVTRIQLSSTQQNFKRGNKCEVRSSEAGHLANSITWTAIHKSVISLLLQFRVHWVLYISTCQMNCIFGWMIIAAVQMAFSVQGTSMHILTFSYFFMDVESQDQWWSVG